MVKCETHIHTHYCNLYTANDPCFGVNSPMGKPFPVTTPHSWTLQSRGPWLAGRLCCPARSTLTMTSSETLIPSRRLIFFVLTGLGLTVSYRLETRGSPIYSTCLFHRATSGTPASRLAANQLFLHQSLWLSPPSQRLSKRTPRTSILARAM